MGSELPRPEAVLDVSARQNLPAASVTATPAPRTIHNFGGFPGELGEVMYPARCVQMLLKPVRIGLHGPLGLDHGTRSVRYHIYPRGDAIFVQGIWGQVCLHAHRSNRMFSLASHSYRHNDYPFFRVPSSVYGYCWEKIVDYPTKKNFLFPGKMFNIFQGNFQPFSAPTVIFQRRGLI
jgi:hypothetical protein